MSQILWVLISIVAWFSFTCLVRIIRMISSHNNRHEAKLKTMSNTFIVTKGRGKYHGSK